MNIIVGFSRPNKFTLHGKLIEEIDNAPFDHAYMRCPLDKINRDLIFQSIAVGVQIVSPQQFAKLSTPVEEYSLDCTIDQFVDLMRFCIDTSGQSYGFLSVIGMGISELLSKIGIKISNPFEKIDKNLFCSALIAKALLQIDPKDFNIDPDNVSPRMLRDLLVKLKIKRVL
jgi:hypothetical protein